jgi:hypothetical protein
MMDFHFECANFRQRFRHVKFRLISMVEMVKGTHYRWPTFSGKSFH